MVSRWRFELQTLRLKVECSTDWANETFIMAAPAGFEPTECQSQSLMPYHLAKGQYHLSGGGRWIWTIEPEGTDLQSAAFGHFAIPPLKWCRQRESNPQPDDYKSTALPITLCRHPGGRYRTRTYDPLLVRQVL